MSSLGLSASIPAIIFTPARLKHPPQMTSRNSLKPILFLSLLLALLSGFSTVLRADIVNIAVAANFAPVMKQLITSFELTHPHQVRMTSGSSGKFYAQISQGAPFSIFFSADKAKIDALEKADLIITDSRLTYATGRLVLWSEDETLDLVNANALKDINLARLAIANPKLAPYGVAAKQVLAHLELTSQLSRKLIKGENVAQTYQFIASGNVKLGLIAVSQVYYEYELSHGYGWKIPKTWHNEIAQDAALIHGRKNLVAAKAFLDFIQSAEAKLIIHRFGYETSERED